MHVTIFGAAQSLPEINLILKSNHRSHVKLAEITKCTWYLRCSNQNLLESILKDFLKIFWFQFYNFLIRFLNNFNMFWIIS